MENNFFDKYVCLLNHAMHRTTVFIVQLFLTIKIQCLKVVKGDLRLHLQKQHHDTSSKARNPHDDQYAVYYIANKTIVSFEFITVVKL